MRLPPYTKRQGPLAAWRCRMIGAGALSGLLDEAFGGDPCVATHRVMGVPTWPRARALAPHMQPSVEPPCPGARTVFRACQAVRGHACGLS